MINYWLDKKADSEHNQQNIPVHKIVEIPINEWVEALKQSILYHEKLLDK